MQKIRLSLVQGKSIKQICRELKVSRKVVRKVLRSGQTEFRFERKHQPLPRMGAWRDELERLLAPNATKPSREGLTLIRIFEQLRKDNPGRRRRELDDAVDHLRERDPTLEPVFREIERRSERKSTARLSEHKREC